MKRKIGSILGVQVDDIFYNWGQVFIIGFHIQMVGAIDSLMFKDGVEDPLDTIQVK